ncbi:hypothetical protein ACPA9J_00110 [Pseudomonas aeruginosa]
MVAHSPRRGCTRAATPGGHRGYLASAQQAVANSQQDLKESEDAAAQAQH